MASPVTGAFGRAALVHGVPGPPDVRARGRRGGAGAARRDHGARGGARAAGRGGCGAHGPDDRVPQRLRAALQPRSRLRRSLAAQVRLVRRRQYARHEVGDAVCGSRSARPARRHVRPCSSATGTSGWTTSGSATSAIAWVSTRCALRSRSARDVLSGVSQSPGPSRRGDRRRRGRRAEGAWVALGRRARHPW